MKYLLSVLSLFTILPTFAQHHAPDSIPFGMHNQNTIYVKAVLNETDTLILNFDTGTTELVLTNSTLKNRLKIPVSLYATPYRLKIGNTIYKTKIYDAELSGHGTDGRFGWDLFKGKVVELNYDRNLMIVHPRTPERIVNDKTYSKLKLKYLDDLLIVESTIIQNKKHITAHFLFDTGYQRTVMLDTDLLKEVNFPTEDMKELNRVTMRGAQNNAIPVITSNLDGLRISNYRLQNIPIQQITAAKPLKGQAIHILGNEVLKRFNMFLDFREEVVYLKPNKLYDMEYLDRKQTNM